MLYNVAFLYESPDNLLYPVLFAVYLGGYIADNYHSPAYEGMGQGFASILCDITSDTTNITDTTLTGFSYCIYGIQRGRKCIKV